MTGFWQGVSGLTWAWRFVHDNRRLMKYFLAPVLVSAVVLAAGGWAAFSFVGSWIDLIVARLPSWLSWLEAVVTVLVIVLLSLAGYFAFFVVASVATAPFCEILSEELEEELTGKPGPPFTMGGFVRDLVLGVAHAIRRLVGYAVIMLLLFAIGVVVPVVGPIVYSVGGMWLTIRAASFDCADAVFARKGWSYRDKSQFLKRHRGFSYGLGSAVSVLMLVPLLNLFVLPLGAMAATRFIVEAAVDNGGQS